MHPVKVQATRVGLAQALMHEPQLLVLDEPSDGVVGRAVGEGVVVADPPLGEGMGVPLGIAALGQPVGEARLDLPYVEDSAAEVDCNFVMTEMEDSGFMNALERLDRMHRGPRHQRHFSGDQEHRRRPAGHRSGDYPVDVSVGLRHISPVSGPDECTPSHANEPTTLVVFELEEVAGGTQLLDPDPDRVLVAIHAHLDHALGLT